MRVMGAKIVYIGFVAVKIFHLAELWNSSNSSKASAQTRSYSCCDTLISVHHQRFMDLNNALICSLYKYPCCFSTKF